MSCKNCSQSLLSGIPASPGLKTGTFWTRFGNDCPRQRKPMTTPELQERFQAQVEAHKKILYKVCNSYCKNRDDREDLAQEIILQLWRSFGTFDARCLFSTWMYRIALNVAISFTRREGTRNQHVVPA